MAKGTRKCKICGAEYPYCKTPYVPGTFRYQDVACCAEHGQQYLAEVIKARSGNEAAADTDNKTDVKTTKSTKSVKKKTTKKTAAKATEETSE